MEIALLIQATYRLRSVEYAQSYLGKRIHRLQDVPALGRMGASILHTLLHMANKMNLISIKHRINNALQQYTSLDGKNFTAIKFNVADEMLSPMITIKSYGAKFKK